MAMGRPKGAKNRPKDPEILERTKGSELSMVVRKYLPFKQECNLATIHRLCYVLEVSFDDFCRSGVSVFNSKEWRV